MTHALSKRSFLGYLAATPFALMAAKHLGSVDFIGSAEAASPEAAKASGPFTLPPLPYKTNALKNVIDEQTMILHHGKHHQTYVDNLNKAIAEDKKLKGKSLDDIIRNISKYDSKHDHTVRNNAGGHWNHSLFWETMSPTASQPSSELMKAIEDSFGDFERFKTAFEDAGKKQFGSGWVWLIVTSEITLEIVTTPNQDNPLMDVVEIGGIPILGNDVWEHAYYLRYQNKRADYLKAWWKVVNWAKVSELFNAAQV